MLKEGRPTQDGTVLGPVGLLVDPPLALAEDQALAEAPAPEVCALLLYSLIKRT